MSDALNHAFLMMEAAHQVLHETEPDYDDTLFVALTERDCILIGLALACLFFDYPCLQPDSQELQQRLLELTGEQKPDWMIKGGDGEG